MDYSPIIVVIVCLLFSAFFSGIEIAFISADKLRIELAKNNGSLAGRIMAYHLQHPTRFIGTTLVGNNLALVLYGIFMTQLLEPLLGPWLSTVLPEVINNEATQLAVQTVLATLLVLVTAEFTPKSIFMIDPNSLLSFFALPFRIIYIILYPIVYIIDQVSKFTIVRIFRFKYQENTLVFGLTDLNDFIRNTLSEQASSDVSSPSHTNHRVDAKIFNNALEFKTIKVRECMIPRTEVIAVDLQDSIEELTQAFMESGHSKIVVYKDTIDDVIGYCHSLELFKKPQSIDQILTPIIIVPETAPANELMIQFITEHKSLALVVDEFGGTAGIVSIEDIIEEIFGEIQDEHDDEDWVEHRIDSHNFLISARHEIDYLNDKYEWKIPEGEYDTLGGYILSLTGEIPLKGDIIPAQDLTFTIMTMGDNRIDTVKITLSSAPSS